MTLTGKQAQQVYDTRLKISERLKKRMISDCFDVYVWQNKHQKIISTNRKGTVIVKRLSKNTNFNRSGSVRTVTFVKSTRARLELQEYKVYQSFDNDGSERISFCPLNLVRFTEKEIVKISRGYSGWGSGLASPRPFWPALASNWYWTGNIDEVMAAGPFKYLDFSKINCSFSRLQDLVRLYKIRDKAEYLQKISSNNAVATTIGQIISSRVDLRSVSWKMLKMLKPYLKKGLSVKSALMMENVQKKYPYMKVSCDFLKYADCEADFDIIHKVHKVAKVGCVKLQNYLFKNEIDLDRYAEYLKHLEFLKVHLTKSLAMPNDFSEVFDEVSEEVNSKRDKILMDKFKKAEKKKSVFNTTFEGLLFFVPSTKTELVKEGLALHNCLASYVDKLANDWTTVLFVRQADKPSKPLYALEVRNDGTLKQLRAKYNKDVNQKDTAIVNRYLKNYYARKKLALDHSDSSAIALTA